MIVRRAFGACGVVAAGATAEAPRVPRARLSPGIPAVPSWQSSSRSTGGATFPEGCVSQGSEWSIEAGLPARPCR